MTQSELMRQALIGGRTHKSTRSKKSITASVSGIRSANFDMDGNATRSNRRCSTDSGEMNGISVTATSIRIGDMAKAPDRKKTKPAEGGSESPQNCGNCDPPPTGSDESGPLGRVCGQTIMAKNTRVVNQTCRESPHRVVDSIAFITQENSESVFSRPPARGAIELNRGAIELNGTY